MSTCKTCSGRTRVLRQLKGFTRAFFVTCPRCDGTGTVVDWADWVVFAQAGEHSVNGGSDQFHLPNSTHSAGRRDDA